MHTFSKTSAVLCGTLSLVLLNGCMGMSEQEKSTAIGAGVGAVGGSIQSSGSAAGTLGGAAVGGYLGHEIEKNPIKDIAPFDLSHGADKRPTSPSTNEAGIVTNMFLAKRPRNRFLGRFS